MQKKHRLIISGAVLVIVLSCAVSVLLLLQATGLLPSGQPASSVGVEQQSMDTSSAELTTHSAVEISGDEESGSSGAYGQAAKVTLPVAAGYNAMPMQQGKESLDGTPLETLYDQIAEKAYQISEEAEEGQLYPAQRITIQGSEFTDAQVVQALSAFLHDHPEVFWISSQYGYSSGNGRTVVQLYSVLPASECGELSQRIMAEVGKVLNRIPQGESALDREIYLYEQVMKYCSYDEEAAANSNDWRAHTIVGAFLDSQAVCEGYARAFQLLLNQAGVPCMLVTGSAGGAHMWNLVRIDGQWYHVDTTWDDNGSTGVYSYLNLTDEMIGQDHTVYPEAGTVEAPSASEVYNLPLPACTAVKANYFRAKGVTLDSLDESETIATAIEEAAAEQAESIAFYIDESLNYDDTVSRMFQESPYQFMYGVRTANVTAEHPVDYDNCTYVEATASRGLVVLLAYE